MIKKITSVIFIFFLLAYMQVSSLYAQLANNSFVINGNIYNIKDSTFIELIDIESQVRVASAYTQAGKFIMTGSVKFPTSCWLITGEEYAILQVENLKMDFQSPDKNMRWKSVTSGGYEQSLQNQLNDLQRPYEEIASTNSKLLRDSLDIQESKRSNIKKVIEDANKNLQNTYIQFGKTHINSYLGLRIIYRNREEIGKDLINNLYKKLSKELKNTPQAEGLKIFMYERLAVIGKPIIDFNAKTFDGEHFKLSDIKGKYVYLTFGEACCAPCRLENKLIKDNYTRLKDKISFVNFSLDKNRKAWEDSSKHDGITWNNVTDLEKEIGKTKNLYAVQAIPTSFLIDKNGIIIEKFIGFRPDIISIIEKMAN